MSLLLNMLSRLVITFLPRSKHLLISWLQSPSAVIVEPRKIKAATVSMVSPSICHEVMGPDAMILVIWMLSFKPTFSLSSFTFMHWRRKWQPTPGFLPGESQGRGDPGGLPSMGSQSRTRLKWLSLACLSGKGVRQGCILSPAYLTYMQSTSWETLGWRKHSWNQNCWEKYQ